MRPADRPTCLPEGAAAVTTGPEDDPTLVAFAGSGTRGVVLAPQSDGQVCQWARELVRLVEEGYLVATFSWSGVGERSFTDAVDVLRGVGATEVAFVGASKGGMYSAALADELDPVTVVALGPPAEYDGHDARSTSTSYTGPLLVVASTDDRSVSALSSKLVSRADDPATFVELSGGAHGVELLQRGAPRAGRAADRRRAGLGLRRLDTPTACHPPGWPAVGASIRRTGAARASPDRSRRRTARPPG